MNIVMNRDRLYLNATGGYMDGFEERIFTLEDKVRDVKVAGVTAIPAGIYDLKLRTEGGMTKRYAEKFPDMHRGMIWLQDVPDFTFVYIHIGNYPRDTDGCILVGTGHGHEAVWNSTVAYKRIYPLIVEAIEGDGCTLEICDVESG